MKKPAVTWDTLDWAALDRLRDRFLAAQPVGACYWNSRSDLENYDFTFAQRIAWKWDAVLRELRLRGWTPPSDALLDWGCGSGIAGRQLVDFFGPEHFQVLRVFDRSPLAMEFAVKKARTVFPALRIEPCSALLFGGPLDDAIPQPGTRNRPHAERASPSPGRSPLPSDGREVRGEGGRMTEPDRSTAEAAAETASLVADSQGRIPGHPLSRHDDRAGPEAGASPVGTLVISHVLNELDEAGGRELRQAIDRADAVLWVEPGTHAESRSLIAVREQLSESFHVIAPCTHQATCGLRAPENQRHWCHHFATPPPNIMADSNWVRFAQRAGIDLRSLPYSFLVLERKGLRDPVPGLLHGGYSRIIGTPRLYKGYAKIFSCQADGVRELVLQKRDAPPFFKSLDKARLVPLCAWELDGARIRSVKEPCPSGDRF